MGERTKLAGDSIEDAPDEVGRCVEAARLPGEVVGAGQILSAVHGAGGLGCLQDAGPVGRREMGAADHRRDFPAQVPGP